LSKRICCIITAMHISQQAVQNVLSYTGLIIHKRLPHRIQSATQHCHAEHTPKNILTISHTGRSHTQDKFPQTGITLPRRTHTQECTYTCAHTHTHTHAHTHTHTHTNTYIHTHTHTHTHTRTHRTHSFAESLLL